MTAALLRNLPAALHRPAKWLGITILVVTLYAALGFLWVPRLVERYARDYAHHQLQRELHIGQVRFNPFTFTLRLDQVQLRDAQAGTLVALQGLMINAELSSVVTRTLHFKAITLDRPQVNAIVAADGKFNLDLRGSRTATPDHDTPVQLPAIQIDRFELHQGQVHLEDQSRATPLRTDLRPIEFSLTDFRTLPGHENGFHFQASSLAKESFDWQGDFSLQPFASTGTLKIRQLQAQTVQQYLAAALPVQLNGGRIAATAHYRLALGDRTELRLSVPEVQLDALQVAPKRAPDSNWISAERIALQGIELRYPERQADIKRVSMDQAQIQAWFDPGYRLNLLDLIPPSEPGAPVWATQVGMIAITNATIPVEDRSLTPAATFKLDHVMLSMEDYRSTPGSVVRVNSQVRVNDSGQIAAQGTVNLDTSQAQLHLQVDALPLTAFQPYAAAATDLRIEAGTLSTSGDLALRGTATARQPALQYQGDVAVAGLHTQDTVDHLDFVNWRQLAMQKLRYSQAPDRLTIAQVTVTEPYGRFILRTDRTTNIQQVLRLKATGDSPSPAPSPSRSKANGDLQTRIAQIRISNGSMDFTDYTVTPNFATGIARLTGSITGLSSDNGSRAQVALAGQVDRYAPVAIGGEVNFLAADTYSDMKLSFRNMELTTFNPYSGKFAGYSIAKGKLSTEMRYQIRDRQLDASHHIIIDQLEFGDATDSKDAVPLPVKFAVSLLKDRHGVIDLDLPVGGSLDDPAFKVGPIIWKALVGLVSKIVTAPFAALGHLFGGGEELAFVDFAPGSAQLPVSEQAKLNQLAQAMAERPQLKLDLPMTVVTPADIAALDDASFQRAVSALLPANATAAQRLKTLTGMYQQQFNQPPVWPESVGKSADVTDDRIRFLEAQLKTRYPSSPSERSVLAQSRADQVQQTLLANPELSPERVFITERRNDVESPVGKVRMQLMLQ